jgi:hypothetical protein
MRPRRAGPILTGPVGSRRIRRLGVFGLLRGKLVLPLAVVLVAGSASAAFAHDDHDETATEEDAGAVMVQVGEDVDHEAHGATGEATAEASAEEIEVVDALVADAGATAARFAEIGAAEAAGYVALAFKPVRGTELSQTHAMNPALFDDGRLLDPAAPEGLMYVRFPDGETVLVALVFTAAVGEGPTPAGDLIAWHTHFTCLVDGQPQALPAGVETCRDGSAAREPRREMLHLWVIEHPDGPFAHGFTRLAAKVVVEAREA